MGSARVWCNNPKRAAENIFMVAELLLCDTGVGGMAISGISDLNINTSQFLLALKGNPTGVAINSHD